MKQHTTQWHLLEVLLSVLIFVAPSNLFYILDRSTGYTGGLFSDYLLLRVFASDLVVLALLLVLAVQHRSQIHKQLTSFTQTPWQFPILSTWLLLGLVQLTQTLPGIGIEHWLRLSTWAATGLLLWKERTKLQQSRVIALSITSTVLFQAGLGLWQYLTQTAAFGYLFLGEPDVSRVIGLAQSAVRNSVAVLPYGTTAHPNILGGVLATYLLVLWQFRQKVPALLWLCTSILALGVVLCTESLSAVVTLVLGVVLVTIQRTGLRTVHVQTTALALAAGLIISVPVLLATIQPEREQSSLFRRKYLQETALTQFVNKPLFGSGLGQFTAEIKRNTLTYEPVAFLQPVHHVGLLWTAETGILGLVLVFFVLTRLRNKKWYTAVKIAPLAAIFALDHYLLTQPVGAALICFLLCLEE